MAPSTAHTRSGQLAAQARSCSTWLVLDRTRNWPNTVSHRSMATAVCEALWGSIPITTAAIYPPLGSRNEGPRWANLITTAAHTPLSSHTTGEVRWVHKSITSQTGEPADRSFASEPIGPLDATATTIAPRWIINQIVPHTGCVTRLASPGEIRCGSRVSFDPGSEPDEPVRCPNVAEYHVALRDGDWDTWVCADDVRWWAKSGQILGRVSESNPAFETDAMALEWGTPDEAERAAERLKRSALDRGHSFVSDGIEYLPDGTARPFKYS